MNSQKFFWFCIYCLVGAAMIISGILLAVLNTTFVALPFVLIGIGAGSFTGGLSSVVSTYMMKKDPNMAKQVDIISNDERNITIENKARAKTDVFMSMLLYGLVIFLALMQVQPLVVLVFTAAIFVRMFVLLYFLSKYHREM